MSLNMTKSEREAFLADVRIGVLSIADGERGPLSAPIWYLYEPGGDFQVSYGRDGHKARVISEGTRVSLVAQTEAQPYKYVSVEGVVTGVGTVSDAGDLMLRMATHYLGEDEGRRYAAGANSESLVATVRIERWMTIDYSKR
jgi:nitroimidazol reductase NimA-like FMN-containing flavoprotein (pyridoxamine 5'-phosphate oxidase superfamily)